MLAHGHLSWQTTITVWVDYRPNPLPVVFCACLTTSLRHFLLPQQVRKLTRRCQIVGRRHPIALVRAAHGNIIEVSTFDTSSESPYDAAALAKQVFKVVFGTCLPCSLHAAFLPCVDGCFMFVT